MGFFDSLATWFSKGGVVMWPILFFSLYGAALCWERWLNYRRQERSLNNRLEMVTNSPAAMKEALAAGFDKSSSADRLTRIVMENGGHDEDVRTEKVRHAFQDEHARLEKHLGIISVVATVLPMLGLLGTVTGMITSFGAIAEHGTGNPRVVADGISEALITTEAGLITSIPLLYLHQVLGNRADSLARKLDEYTTHALHVFAKGKGR